MRFKGKWVYIKGNDIDDWIYSWSMIYELFEWSLTIIMSPQSAENYNGQQGDMWDAQKDMALALLGSIISSILYFALKGKRE